VQAVGAAEARLFTPGAAEGADPSEERTLGEYVPHQREDRLWFGEKVRPSEGDLGIPERRPVQKKFLFLHGGRNGYAILSAVEVWKLASRENLAIVRGFPGLARAECDGTSHRDYLRLQERLRTARPHAAPRDPCATLRAPFAFAFDDEKTL